MSLASASRDASLPDGEDPAALDITRASVRHLSFGHGIRHCLGAPLARLEILIALRTVLDRFTRFELAAPMESLRWIPAGMMRGLLSLPVRYETA
ncbi:cytochrome P450 [Streptomyces sp. NPDC001792]|uniref:cytochrome P450 n=1 Tax=Streptomyces sp. NPDC001792 TaxID=3154524 RepID=UPI00332844DE